MLKINYKYLNILLLLGNFYLLFLLRNVWLEAVSKIFNVLFPFILGFALAYIFYPLVKMLNNKKIPKTISVFIVIFIIIFFIILTLYYTVPIIFSGIINLVSIIEENIINIGYKYDININNALNFVIKHSNKIINFLTKIITKGFFVSKINKGIEFITASVMTVCAFIYFLFDMDKIRNKIKIIFKDKKLFSILNSIDKELSSYIKGFLIFMLVQFFEYTIVFLIIGHPNYLLLGFLASITSIIPYFGGLLTNFVALFIAMGISKKLLLLTVIVLIILPNIDEYIISPKIYNKTNKISPMFSIFFVFLFGKLFGFIGIVISMPLAIIINVVFKSYKNKILSKIKV